MDDRARAANEIDLPGNCINLTRVLFTRSNGTIWFLKSADQEEEVLEYDENATAGKGTYAKGNQ